LAKVRTEFPEFLGEMNEAAREFRLNDNLGGGVIAFRNLDKPSKYQSAEFAAIAVDELTKNTRETFDVLRGSLRSPGVSHTVFLGATNPGGPGHLWVKQLWLDEDMPPELVSKKDEFAFIKSLPTDNPHLEQSYWDELNSLPDDLRRAWVEGDWSVFAGQAFTGFRSEKHVIEPFQIPRHWSMWRAVDWGYHAPFCCLWLAQDPDTRRVYVFRELYEKGVTDVQQAKLIVNNTPEDACTVTWADPSMWSKKSAGDRVFSTADEYRDNGIVLTKGNNDRISGKRKVDRVLAGLEDGKPGLQIMSNCRNLIRTLPALPYDETKVEDVDTDAEDHAYDCLRYGLTQVRTTENRRKREMERMLIDPMIRQYSHLLKTNSEALPFAEI
jgi:PBSX family phage terminase large subunit